MSSSALNHFYFIFIASLFRQCTNAKNDLWNDTTFDKCASHKDVLTQKKISVKTLKKKTSTRQRIEDNCRFFWGFVTILCKENCSPNGIPLVYISVCFFCVFCNQSKLAPKFVLCYQKNNCKNFHSNLNVLV